MTVLLQSPQDVREVPTPMVHRKGSSVGKRLLHDRVAVVGGLILLVLLLTLLAAPWLVRVDPTLVDAPNRLAGPSQEHPLGTDMLGRDMASRLLYGGRTSAIMALAASLGITAIGLSLGIMAGLLGGIVDSLVMRLVDILQALPLLIVAMVAIGLLGRGPSKLVAVFVLVGWPSYARVVRAATLSLRERGFVEASLALGASKFRMMIRHLLPNLAAPATVLSTLELGRILLGLTALSFLGFGVQPPYPEWGRMMADARPYFYTAPRMLVIPGLAISVLVLAVNLFGDGVRDAFDGKMRTR